MSKGYNKITLMGRLTRDPETRSTTGGASVTAFSLAVGRTWRSKEGEQQEATSFINCVAWGKTGETIAQYLGKGDPLLLDGRLDQRQYDKDGETRYAYEVVVENFNFIGGKNDNEAPRQQGKSDDVVIEDIDDRPIDLSEIPF